MEPKPQDEPKTYPVLVKGLDEQDRKIWVDDDRSISDQLPDSWKYYVVGGNDD